ncbi:MAG TPA: hypothetical protein VFJ16_03105, partial [Longimicrobium sp.]|nr:hypothetical protein [Longimicrobium sp.]
FATGEWTRSPVTRCEQQPIVTTQLGGTRSKAGAAGQSYREAVSFNLWLSGRNSCERHLWLRMAESAPIQIMLLHPNVKRQ